MHACSGGWGDEKDCQHQPPPGPSWANGEVAEDYRLEQANHDQRNSGWSTGRWLSNPTHCDAAADAIADEKNERQRHDPECDWNRAHGDDLIFTTRVS